MGGAVSSGQDNDELVDNLMESKYIKTKKVEQVFRAVDRADYVSYRENAYKDLAWKDGNIHLSAPCIYSEVLEGLNLEPGLSFLNLGSGTGYLSTMAGLLLQQHGTNHGIELHEDCLKYAYEKLEKFKQKSLALNEFDFCEPIFIQGNCLSIIPGRQYDRVYCGAACPESHEAFIKQFVRIGGILVMPYKDQLLRLKRVDEDTWLQHTMLPVSFATLVIPPPSEHNLLHLPECNPLPLQELCRGKIRHRLRQNIWCEHSDLETKKPILPVHQRETARQHTLRRFVIPIFEESDEALSDDEQDIAGRARFLLNVDAHPGEAITTTLQLVRAVIQPNQNDNDENTQDTTVNTTRSSQERQQRWKSDAKSSSSSTSTEGTSTDHTSSTSTGHTSSASADHNTSSTSADTNDNNNEERSERDGDKSTTSYSNMSESDSDAEQESAFVQRKKIAKCEKTDSGIVEDINLFNNEDGSSSSTTNHSDSDMTDTTDTGDPMDIDLPDIAVYKSYRNNTCDSRSASNDSASRKKSTRATIAHYVDSTAFAVYMREKIQQLPLPFSIKLYINYNRKFEL